MPDPHMTVKVDTFGVGGPAHSGPLPASPRHVQGGFQGLASPRCLCGPGSLAALDGTRGGLPTESGPVRVSLLELQLVPGGQASMWLA